MKQQDKTKSVQPSQKPPARAYGGSKQEVTAPGMASKQFEKPMYDPSARTTKERRPVPLRTSASANPGKEPKPSKVGAGSIIKSDELQELRGKSIKV
jgi:hypothetical protein